jgi:hypothetical protein
MIVAEGNLVIVHGRFSGFGAPASGIAADFLVMEEGVLVEHWDVIEDEATRAQSKSAESDVRQVIPRIGRSAISTARLSARPVKLKLFRTKGVYLCGS